MEEKFTFRGSPTSNQDFYMLAVLRGTSVSAFKQNNTNNFDNLGTENEKYFFLCYNHTGDPLSPDRLYWSSDPDDFQFNNSSGVFNQGVVKVNYDAGSTDKILKFRTTFTEKGKQFPGDGKYKNFSSNLKSFDGDRGKLSVSFVPKSYKNLDFVKNIYYSLPYYIKNFNFDEISVQEEAPGLSNKPIVWCFRKITTDITNNVTVPKPTSVTDSDSIYNFVNLSNLDTESGTCTSKFNYGSVKYHTIDGVSAGSSFYTDQNNFSVIYKEGLSVLPKIESNIRITDSLGNSNLIYYDSFTKKGEGFFNINNYKYNRGLLGEDFNIDSGTCINITFNERNHEDCFCNLSGNTNFNEFFDVYLIPSENSAYFPGGFTINDSSRFPACSRTLSSEFVTPPNGNLEFYNNVTRAPAISTSLLNTSPNSFIDCTDTSDPESINLNKLVSYKKIYNLLFFNEIGSLPTPTWTSSSASGFPQIARDNYPLTFFSWDSYENARQCYMYNYCGLTSKCGFCFGKNSKNKNTCTADALTKKHASLTSSGNALVPLAGDHRATGNYNTGGDPYSYNDTAMIIMGVVLGLVIIAFAVVLYKCETK